MAQLYKLKIILKIITILTLYPLHSHNIENWGFQLFQTDFSPHTKYLKKLGQ